MKTIAYYALHYGKEYLAWSIRSVQDFVDEIHVLYAAKPSFGHSTREGCPETEAELRTEADRFLKKPLLWHRGEWTQESDHRNAAVSIARRAGADQILPVDADEVWDGETLETALRVARDKNAKTTLVRFCHLWRSFDWVCDDPAMPVRIVRPDGVDPIWYLTPQKYPVFHFGYAQSRRIVEYKQKIHGHKNDWRSGWFENKYVKWDPAHPQADVHPTNVNFWTPKPLDLDRVAVLRRLMDGHPGVGARVIE